MGEFLTELEPKIRKAKSFNDSVREHMEQTKAQVTACMNEVRLATDQRERILMTQIDDMAMQELMEIDTVCAHTRTRTHLLTLTHMHAFNPLKRTCLRTHDHITFTTTARLSTSMNSA